MADLTITPQPANTLVISPSSGPSTNNTLVVDSSRGGIMGPPGDWGVPFTMDDDIVVRTGVKKFRFPLAGTIQGVSASLGTPAQGADVVVDVLKNGVSILNAPKLVIAAGEYVTASEVTSLATSAVSAGDYLTVNVDQIGSTISGADLVVIIRYRTLYH